MKACVIDIDGTLIDFRKFDNQFISSYFCEHRFIQVLDRFLWKLNSLDFFTNKESFLKIRLLIYSILASNVVYSKLIREYNMCYLAYQKQEFVKAQLILDTIKSRGYAIYLISNNNICSAIIKSSARYSCLSPIKLNIKRKKLYKLLAKAVDIHYVVGNNYMDDILSAKRLKKNNSCLKSIYVGNSSIKQMFNADFYALSIEQILEIVA